MRYTEPTVTSPPTDAPNDDRRALESLATCRERLVEQIHQRIIGQQEVIDLLLVCLFAGGHGLFVGVPGLGKTLLVQTLAATLDLHFARLQFTPDLMPGDITGSEVLEEDAKSGRRHFRFVAGPVFANLLLADEINRTPPKTQAALLQAMQEAQVSAGGKTHPLPLPFHVFATQNPIEQEGTFPLPEAQLDRFMVQLRVGYPDADTEAAIVAMRAGASPAPKPVLNPVELQRFQALVGRIAVPPSVVGHIVAILRASRPTQSACPPSVRELLQWGAGPRAGQQLAAAAQAKAALDGRPAATIADVRALAIPVLEHRLVRSFVAESRGISSEDLMRSILDAVPS